MALATEHDGLELIRETSLRALATIELPDVVIVDGDHNYYTVSEELRLIGDRGGGAELPLLLFHDVSWPHARRDDYFDRRRSRPTIASRWSASGRESSPVTPAPGATGCHTRSRRRARAGRATAC